jgi:inositol transport system substrate-binding protein
MIMIVTAFAFAGGEKEKPAAAAAQKKVVVGLSMVQKDSDWWNTQNAMLESVLQGKGYETVTVWAAGNQQKQINDVEDLIARGVDVIIMGPVQQEGSMVAIESAHKAGIPVLCVGRRSNSDKQLAEVYANEAQFGIEQVRQIAKDYPNGANIVFLFGPVGAGYAIQMWEDGIQPELKKFPNLKIIQRYDNPSDITSDGMKTAEDAITRFGDQVQVIAASNDGLALGAVRAVQAAGLGDKIKVYGAGLTLMGMEAIYDGTMRYSTLKSQAKNALALGDLVDLVLKGGKPAQKAKMIDPVVITKETMMTVKDAMFGGTPNNPSTWTPKK